jgi:hypothetical protein
MLKTRVSLRGVELWFRAGVVPSSRGIETIVDECVRACSEESECEIQFKLIPDKGGRLQ